MRLAVRLCAISLVILACGLYLTASRSASAQTQPQPGQVIISELRFRGPNGTRDEFIEIYNNTNSPITVQAGDGSGAWAVSMSGTFNNTIIRGNVCTIPNGTVIPARGHVLCANPDPDFGSGYSLTDYPSGNPTPTPTTSFAPAPSAIVAPTPTLFAKARPDRSFTVDDIPDGFGIALFTTASIPNQILGTRLDAFGFTNSPALYREGTGFSTIPSTSNEHTIFRDLRTGRPKDTNNNAADFRYVSTTGSIQTQLNGSPGPENLASPREMANIAITLLDPSAAATSSPNRERSPVVEPNAPQGTLIIRRTFKNNTGQPISRLRVRVANITTRGTPASECGGTPCADMRALTSPDGTATLSNSTVVAVRGMTLEENPPITPEGGGLNSSLSAHFITLAAPLPNGQSVNVQFKLGIVRDGPFRFLFFVEAQHSPPPIITKPASSTARR